MIKCQQRPPAASFRFSTDGRHELRRALGTRGVDIEASLEDLIQEHLTKREWRGDWAAYAFGEPVRTDRRTQRPIASGEDHARAIATALRALIRRIDDAGPDFGNVFRLKGSILDMLNLVPPPSEGDRLRQLRDAAIERLKALAPKRVTKRGRPKDLWFRDLAVDVGLVLYLRGFDVESGRETLFGRILRTVDHELFECEADSKGDTSWGIYRVSREAAEDVNQFTRSEWRRVLLEGARAPLSFWRQHLTLQ